MPDQLGAIFTVYLFILAVSFRSSSNIRADAGIGVAEQGQTAPGGESGGQTGSAFDQRDHGGLLGRRRRSSFNRFVYRRATLGDAVSSR